MSNPCSPPPPLGLNQPILGGIVVVCFGFASSNAPELFKPACFVISMTVGFFALWLLACTQWSSLYAIHLRFKTLIGVGFSAVGVLGVTWALFIALRGQSPKSEYRVVSQVLSGVTNSIIYFDSEPVPASVELETDFYVPSLQNTGWGYFSGREFRLTNPEATRIFTDRLQSNQRIELRYQTLDRSNGD